VLPTVGAGDWEAETCDAVEAVGMVSPAPGLTRIGVVFRADAPHAQPKEPVVLAIDGAHVMRIDAAATKRASEAGATTLPALRRALVP
jgi:hypothetical protein